MQPCNYLFKDINEPKGPLVVYTLKLWQMCIKHPLIR